jgi:hypothetical protein
MFYVYTQAFCGMTVPHGEYEMRVDAMSRAKRRIAWVEEQRCEVTRLTQSQWEIQDDGSSVPDFCGVLRVSKCPPMLQ